MPPALQQVRRPTANTAPHVTEPTSPAIQSGRHATATEASAHLPTTAADTHGTTPTNSSSPSPAMATTSRRAACQHSAAPSPTTRSRRSSNSSNRRGDQKNELSNGKSHGQNNSARRVDGERVRVFPPTTDSGSALFASARRVESWATPGPRQDQNRCESTRCAEMHGEFESARKPRSEGVSSRLPRSGRNG